MPAAPLADPQSRLGQLQRGQGRGVLRARADGVAAHEDLLACVLADPRCEPAFEARSRCYAELALWLAVPLEPLFARAVAPAGSLVGETLAGLWALGSPAVRAFVADAAVDEAALAAVVAALFDGRWAVPVDLPPRARALWLQHAREDADCVAAAVRSEARSELAGLTTDELLELGRDAQNDRRDRLLGELCARGDAATRNRLFATLRDDVVYGRVRLAARALGLCADDRPLALAEDYFARPDADHVPPGRLDGVARMRRACLVEYLLHLPPPHALAQARRWRGFGGYFDVAVGAVFREHATPADREALEAYVGAHAGRDGGMAVIDELDALARLGDSRSAPLLLEIAATTTGSQARRRAVQALAMMPDAPGAVAELQAALWDCEDETAAVACSFVPELHAAGRARLVELVAQPLAAPELRQRASARLRRPR
ncbi:MAG: hypothetical protein JNK49_01990 [Planctomycetes bacterium]|nr:hypothetical protein [Planctomycetota bacterium]